MKTFSALLALCAGNSPVTGESPSQRPVTRSFDVFFDLRLNKRLSKQSRRRWFEMPSRSLWRHRNVPYICTPGSFMDLLTHRGRDEMADTLQTIFSYAFHEKKNCILFQITPKFMLKGLIDSHQLILVWVMAWVRTGNKPSSEPMMAFITDAYKYIYMYIYMRHSASIINRICPSGKINEMEFYWNSGAANHVVRCWFCP